MQASPLIEHEESYPIQFALCVRFMMREPQQQHIVLLS